MAVRIRMSRHGRAHQPVYRIVAVDSRRQRDGKAIEILGTYDPHRKEQNVEVQIERVHHWLAQGAQLTPNTRAVIAFGGYELPSKDRQPQSKPKQARDGKKYVKPNRRKLIKHRAAKKAEWMAKVADKRANAAKAREAAEAEAAQAEASEATEQPAEGDQAEG